MSLSSSLSYIALRPALGMYNTLHRIFTPNRHSTAVPTMQITPALTEIEKRARARRTNISDHLATIFHESVMATPRLIVELGIGEGESHFVFERVARHCDAQLVSVDISDCSQACTGGSSCHVVQFEDVEFAARFPQWCRERSLPSSSVDVLFIDTSHFYQHTFQELRVWLPLLSSHCKVIFHDTNLRRIMRRADGTLWLAWINQRGVIRAIEEQLGARFNERRDFVASVAGWKIRHWSYCNGLTVLER